MIIIIIIFTYYDNDRSPDWFGTTSTMVSTPLQLLSIGTGSKIYQYR